MKLYTLISIALGVFGGTYAALAAMRTHLEALIKTAAEKADTHYQKVFEHYGHDSETTKCAQQRKAWIQQSSSLWNYCNAIPACLFALIVFSIAIWVLCDWDAICTQSDANVVDRTKFPWTGFYYCLLILVAVDLLCFLGATIAWWVCKFTSRALRQQYKTVMEEESKKITLLPAAAPPVNP